MIQLPTNMPNLPSYRESVDKVASTQNLIAVASATNHRLSEALQRAAAGRDVSGLVGDIDALRRDPLKKRALWPRLRALRRTH